MNYQLPTLKEIRGNLSTEIEKLLIEYEVGKNVVVISGPTKTREIAHQIISGIKKVKLTLLPSISKLTIKKLRNIKSLKNWEREGRGLLFSSTK